MAKQMTREQMSEAVGYNKRRRIKQTLIGYVLAFTGISILTVLSPSGPCAPGFGALLFMLLPVVAVVLLVRNLFTYLTRQRPNGILILLHLSVLIGLFALVSLNIL